MQKESSIIRISALLMLILTCRALRMVKVTSRSIVCFSTRPESNSLSLDVNLAATRPDLVVAHLKSRKADESLIANLSKLTALREEKNSLIKEGDQARNMRKTLSKEIGGLMKAGKTAEADKLKEQVEESNKVAAAADDKLAVVDVQAQAIYNLLPNLLDDRVPEGNDDSDNPVVHTWNDEGRKLGERYKWHDDIAAGLGGLDSEGAAKISGARFSVLVGPVARLERALTQFFLDRHSNNGYKELSVPYIVSRSVLQGTGQLPKFEDDLFKVSHTIAGEDSFLIPTAEVPVTNLFRDAIVEASSLPLRLVCLTPSFRAEAGSYGKDTRGLLRQHQFHKVELVKICSPETSNDEHEALTQDAEALLKALQLPFRRVLLCSGDLGFSARICYDLEVWLPGQQAYREISSCSNCYDFQARRMMLRIRDSSNKAKGNYYAHTINGSGLAVGRALVAVLENYQQPDGSVVVPEVLRPYMGGLEVLQPVGDKEKTFPYTRSSHSQ